MRGIPVLENYRCILYFKWYDIIILLNSVFRTLQLQNAAAQCFPNCCATGKCDNRTTRWIKQMKLSAHPKLINRTVEVKYGITLHIKQMTKVNKLTLLHLYASVAIGLNHVTTGTHQIFLSIFRLLILIFFRELRDQQVSASFIKFRFNLNLFTTDQRTFQTIWERDK